MSRLNELRYAPLAHAQQIMDGDIPLTETELRALVFNLVDTVLFLAKQVRDGFEAIDRLLPENTHEPFA